MHVIPAYFQIATFLNLYISVFMYIYIRYIYIILKKAFSSKEV